MAGSPAPPRRPGRRQIDARAPAAAASAAAHVRDGGNHPAKRTGSRDAAYVAAALARPQQEQSPHESLMGVAVNDYYLGLYVLAFMIPAFSYATYAVAHGLATRPHDLTWRWLRVAALPTVGMLVYWLYALYRILAWLTQIFKPCYKLFRVVAGPDGAETARVRLHIPFSVLRRPYEPSGAWAMTTWEEAVTASEADRAAVVLVALYTDRLGNHVFQYAYARLRAMYLDVAFEAPRLAAPFDRVATRVERWANPAHAGAGSAGERHDVLLRPRQAGSDGGNATSAGRDARHQLVAGHVHPRQHSSSGRGASGAGAEGGVVASSAWLAVRASVLHTPTHRYVMNTELFVGHEPRLRAWIRPSLEATTAKLRAQWPPQAAQAPTSTDTGVSVSNGGGSTRRRRRPSGAAASALGSAGDAGDGGDNRPELYFGPADVAIHVRLGDILWGHHAAYRPLPASFYRGALHAIGARLVAGVPPGGGVPRVSDAQAVAAVGRVLLVTEDCTHDIVTHMAAHLQNVGYSVVTQSTTLAGDLASLMAAPNLVLSISSFAWWPAFMGGAATVVVPSWGMLQRQSYWPRAGIAVLHDLALRDGVGALPPGQGNNDAALRALIDVHTDARARAAALAVTPRAVVLPLSLPRWGGNFRHTFLSLFD
jgi:hypothetical protein